MVGSDRIAGFGHLSPVGDIIERNLRAGMQHSRSTSAGAGWVPALPGPSAGGSLPFLALGFNISKMGKAPVPITGD